MVPFSDKNIAYITSDSKKSYLNITDLSGNNKIVKSFESSAVDWVAWDNPDSVIVAIRKVGDTGDGKIDKINPSTGKEDVIADYDGGRASYIRLSNDGLKLAFIVAQYENVVDPAISGQIYIVDLTNKSKSSLEKGNQILGWQLE